VKGNSRAPNVHDGPQLVAYVVADAARTARLCIILVTLVASIGLVGFLIFAWTEGLVIGHISAVDVTTATVCGSIVAGLARHRRTRRRRQNLTNGP
jgi:hypothetical protein